MYIPTQCFPHLPSTNIGNRMECQAVVQLIVIQQILSDAVDDKVQQLMLFVKKEGNSKISYLLFGILSRGDEVDRFEMPEIDIPAKNVDVEKLSTPRQSSRPRLCGNYQGYITLQTYFFL